MPGRSGFITNHTTMMYLESPDLPSAAVGIDSQDNYSLKLRAAQLDTAFDFSVGNTQLTIDSRVNGNVTIAPNGAGALVVTSTPGILATVFDTNVTAAGLTLSGTTLAADGTDADISINLTPKGTGSVAITKLSLTTDLTVADGGTGVSTLTSHGVLIGQAASAIAATSAGTANQILVSGGALADPTWSTATYPTTCTKGDILMASSDNAITLLSSASTAGFVLTANGAGTTATFQAPSGGGGGLTWSRETGTPVAAVADHGYVQANAGTGLTTFTLPASCAFGKTIEIIGESEGGFTITHAVGTNQYIRYGNVKTTTTSGSLSSSNRYDTVTLRCTVADTVFTVVHAPIGVLNVV